MIVLHCLWVRDGVLCVWGEDSDLAEEAFAGRAPRRGAAAVPHPFAAASEDVARALASALRDPGGPGEHAVTTESDTTLDLWLPARAGRPQPSPDVPLAQVPRRAGRKAGSEQAGSEQAAPAKAWSVPAVRLSAGDALAILVDPPTETPEVRLGTGWHELGQVALLALEVVSAGRVLPALGEADVDAMDSPLASDPARSRKRSRKGSRKPTLLRAWWHPIPTSPQRAVLRVLARELPGAMRAEDRAGRPGVEIVDGILRVLTDHAVRSAAEPHLPAKTRLDIWLGALTGDDAEMTSNGVD